MMASISFGLKFAKKQKKAYQKDLTYSLWDNFFLIVSFFGLIDGVIGNVKMNRLKLFVIGERKISAH